MNMNVRNDFTIGSDSHGPQSTVLYSSQDGKQILVPTTDIDHWLARGFVRSIFDADECISEVLASASAALDAIQSYAEAARADGVIDASDGSAMQTAQSAVVLFEQAWNKLQRGLTDLYPIKQGQGIMMVDATGFTTAVDPGQVELYIEQGFKRKAEGE